MRDRIDPLIAERAPWLFKGGVPMRAVRTGMDRLLSYGRTIELAKRFEHATSVCLMHEMGMLLARDLVVTGLDYVPRQGPALIVTNHPTGIADGIILHHVLAALRPDLFIYANVDILRILPQMADLIVPVEWRQERRTLTKTRQTMMLTRKALDAGRLGVIFPAGRLAKRRFLRLHERPWMPSAAMIARRFGLPVIPVNIRARNSALFYLFDRIHPTLRDITLFHETLNKARQPFRVTIGEPLQGSALPANSEEGIAILRRATLALGEPDQPGLSIVAASRRPRWI